MIICRDCFPCRPPNPYVSTALTMDDNTNCDGDLEDIYKMISFAWTSGRSESQAEMAVFAAHARSLKNRLPPHAAALR